MPLKQGPNNTLRYYDSSTGRYCKNPFILSLIERNHKKSFVVKEKERRENLNNRALNSKDPNLYEVYSVLEKISPGCVRHINETIYDKKLGNSREIDIVTTKAIYEIKSGKAKHKTKQFLAQKKLAENIHKDYIVFSPGSSDYLIKHLNKMGIKAYNDINQFIFMEKSR